MVEKRALLLFVDWSDVSFVSFLCTLGSIFLATCNAMLLLRDVNL